MRFNPFSFLTSAVSSLSTLVSSLILSASKTGSESGSVDPSDGKAYHWGANIAGGRGDNKSMLTHEASFPTANSGAYIFSAYSIDQHTLAIQKSTGNAYAWGSGTSGQIGDNTVVSKSSPVSVFGGRSYSKISAGVSFNLAIEGSTGIVYAWGLGTGGQLGDNTYISRSSPVSVVGGRSYSQISAGDVFSLAIEGSTGNAYAWGAGFNGQLGDNQNVSSVSSPQSVSSGRSFSQIAAGQAHSLAIEGSTGNAYAWGKNSSGQVGNNGSVARLSPVSVVGGRSYSQISAGSNHSVAIEGSTGNAYAWGVNTNGQIGDGFATNRSSPVSVLGGRSFSQISAGSSHTIAYEPSTGLIWSWGSNSSGQLGLGDGLYPTQTSPVSSTSPYALYSLSNGGGGSAGFLLSSTGNAYMWGFGGSGVLGTNSTTSRSSPVSVVGGRSYRQINIGLNHSLAIEGSTGNAYAWGDNTLGRLGDSTILGRSSPVSVAGAKSFTQISAGWSHSAAIEGSTGRAYTWGSNSNGQLGDNTIIEKSSPVLVAGARSYSKISAGQIYSLVIEASTGRAYAWGLNSSGQLGDNTVANKSSPVSVLGGRSYSSISAAYGTSTFPQSLAIEGSTGNAYAWGDNTNGQIGDSTVVNKSSPVSVVGGRSYSKISAGNSYSLAIEGSTGNAYAWGINTNGILGDNSLISRSSPVSVVGGRSYNEILAAATHSLAYETSTGIIWQWGSTQGFFTSLVYAVSSPVSVGRLFV